MSGSANETSISNEHHRGHPGCKLREIPIFYSKSQRPANQQTGYDSSFSGLDIAVL
ncbi:hypothetical protein PENFLA_c015G09087 [Penicillium flavigenum]|uniref:Uncharacterized protein n=1 Tax=Penicillium flavigenum TaxID=254877 RepID=A0A1V6T4R4_9EURO|nr:hypothetical protein PENFLA_c015G09087 [Penicillium flavigenum]